MNPVKINWDKAYSTQDYYPFGMVEPGRDFSLADDTNFRYGFNNKEDDNDLEGKGDWQDYGERDYLPRLGRFASPDFDSLRMKYPYYSVYQFAGNSPISSIDLDGKEPRGVVNYNSTTGIATLTVPAAHLLSLFSGVPEQTLANTPIVSRSTVAKYPWTAPWYNPKKGGGGITTDIVTLTDNYFAKDSKAYEYHGYGLDGGEWLDILSHEVVHLKQYAKSWSKATYAIGFAFEYLIHGGHNNAPREIEANNSQDNFRAFNDWVNENVEQDGITNLLGNGSLSDKAKMNKIDTWFKKFTKTQGYDINKAPKKVK